MLLPRQSIQCLWYAVFMMADWLSVLEGIMLLLVCLTLHPPVVYFEDQLDAEEPLMKEGDTLHEFWPFF